MKKALLLLVLALTVVVFLLSPISTMNKVIGCAVCIFGMYYVAQMNGNLTRKG